MNNNLNMAPCFPADYTFDATFGNSKFNRERSDGRIPSINPLALFIPRPKRPYIKNIFLRKNRMAAFFPALIVPSAENIPRMKRILSGCNIFQIINAIVGHDSILMVNVPSLGARPQKSSTYQMVDALRFNYPILRQIYSKVPLFVRSNLADGIRVIRNLSAVIGAYKAGRGCVIKSLIIRYRLPDFHHDPLYHVWGSWQCLCAIIPTPEGVAA